MKKAPSVELHVEPQQEKTTPEEAKRALAHVELAISELEQGGPVYEALENCRYILQELADGNGEVPNE